MAKTSIIKKPQKSNGDDAMKDYVTCEVDFKIYNAMNKIYPCGVIKRFGELNYCEKYQDCDYYKNYLKVNK